MLFFSKEILGILFGISDGCDLIWKLYFSFFIKIYRQNLDLRNQFTDLELWNVLKLVRIDTVVTKLGGLGN